MNTKLLVYVGAFIAISGIFFATFHAGRTYQRNIDLLAPQDTSKVVKLPEIIRKLPKETLSAPASAVKPQGSGVDRGLNRLLAPLKPVLAVNCDSLRAVNEELLLPVRAEVTTSKGEHIEVTYDPATEMFTVEPTPLVIIQPEERLITHTIPSVPEPTHDFWAGVDILSASGPGIVASVGFKTVGIALGNVADKPCYGFSFHFTL